MLALHFFGSRYYQRVDMYAKLCALILVGLLIWLYIFSLQVNEEATGANELILDIRYLEEINYYNIYEFKRHTLYI